MISGSLMPISGDIVIMLQVDKIHVGYGKGEVLPGTSLRAETGKITGIIGPNGAGKSTLLKAIFGYLRPRQGHIYYQEQEITGLRPDLILQRGLSYVPQARALFFEMTVWENLLLGGYTLWNRVRLNQALTEVLDRFPLLAERKRQIAGTLSGGEQRILELARAMILHPQMLLLDEPSAALAPKFIDQVYETIQQINHSGIGLVIVEQNVEVILQVADHIFALELGKNAYDGPPADFLETDRLRTLYLGERRV
jgi:ABC-type branched-subunit amino acid transport system ATPase component